jgi:hypothetical protein
MDTLNLHASELSGTIPTNFFHGKSGTNCCISLENLVLSITKLEGPIPDLEPYSLLKLLHFDDNLLTGTIPTSLFNQPELARLNIKSNLPK